MIGVMPMIYTPMISVYVYKSGALVYVYPYSTMTGRLPLDEPDVLFRYQLRFDTLCCLHKCLPQLRLRVSCTGTIRRSAQRFGNIGPELDAISWDR